jgi:hypothetical protein
VTYIDKNREMQTEKIEVILYKHGREVVDRLSYLRDIITQMLAKKSKIKD